MRQNLYMWRTLWLPMGRLPGKMDGSKREGVDRNKKKMMEMIQF
jgi:hypothetical protein